MTISVLVLYSEQCEGKSRCKEFGTVIGASCCVQGHSGVLYS